jgi:hypothetical protein
MGQAQPPKSSYTDAESFREQLPCPDILVGVNEKGAFDEICIDY